MSRWLNNGTESCHQIKVFHVTLRQNAKRWNKILDYCLHIMCKVWLCTNTESRKFDFVEFNIHTISIVIYRNTIERIPNISHACRWVSQFCHARGQLDSEQNTKDIVRTFYYTAAEVNLLLSCQLRCIICCNRIKEFSRMYLNQFCFHWIGVCSKSTIIQS